MLDLGRHAAVREALAKVGLTFKALAREIGVTPTTVILVSQGHRVSHRVQSELARQLGVTPEELYPERYLKENNMQNN